MTWETPKRSLSAFLVCLSFTSVASAQAPLSAIDWLDQPARVIGKTAPPSPRVDEPDVTTSGTAPSITVRPLTTAQPKSVGLVPSRVTGLPETLWQNSDPDAIGYLLSKLNTRGLPASNALLLSLLLAETTPPNDSVQDQSTLTQIRVQKLLELGAVEPAIALIEQAGAETSPKFFDTWAQLHLLNGSEDRPCGALSRAAHLTQDYGLRIFCALRAGDWQTASLTFGSANALGLIAPQQMELLDRFLNPDIFEGSAPLAAPRRISPLEFRLFEAIGEPLPTRPLPVGFAVADLRDIVGWKSQIEAAERLTRLGAIPENVLLGLYTSRKAAASGSVWERVSAVQRFDEALNSNNVKALDKTLPSVWPRMEHARLEVAFSNFYAGALQGLDLQSPSAEIAIRMMLLSSNYGSVVSDADAPPELALAIAIAQGTVPDLAPKNRVSKAVYAAFSGAQGNDRLIALSKDQQFGRAVLETLQLLQRGAAGDNSALSEALATLRALGLEDSARRAAIQVLLLTRAS